MSRQRGTSKSGCARIGCLGVFALFLVASAFNSLGGKRVAQPESHAGIYLPPPERPATAPAPTASRWLPFVINVPRVVAPTRTPSQLPLDQSIAYGAPSASSTQPIYQGGLARSYSAGGEFVGPRGGVYHYSASGKKVYRRH